MTNIVQKIILFVATLGLTVLVVSPAAVSADCGNTKTQIISCDSETGVGSINSLISIALTVLTVGIGVVATGALAYAGMIYASAREEQAKVSEAKGLVRNVVIGLLLYMFTVVIINWLVPGGIISGGDSTGDESSQQTGTGSPTPSGTPSQGEVMPQAQ